MTEKKKFNENQLWDIVMTITPILILMRAGDQLTDDGGLRLLYSGLLGAIGGLIGFGANFLTKNRNRAMKFFATTVIIAMSGSTVYLLASEPTDAEILEQEWVTQQIGKIEFDSPLKLELLTTKIPDSVSRYCSELNFFSDKGKERSILFLQAKMLTDTISIENAYSGALEGMLQKMHVNVEDIELEVFGADEEEVSAMFSYKLNEEEINGYGFMYMKGKTIESIWLLPLKRGFSREYIEEFDAGVLPDYE